MKYISKTVATILVTIPFWATSCFQDEPLNAECDIERIQITIDHPEQFFFQVTDSMQTVITTDSVITFEVRSHADITALAPRFTLTDKTP